MGRFIKSKWALVVVGVLIASLAAFVSPIGVDVSFPSQKVSSPTLEIGQYQMVLTIGTEALAAGVADYTCDGTDDNVQFQQALNALPASGGKLVLLTGNYSFSAAVSRMIDNVTIQGVGRATYLARDGTNPLFDVGTQSHWVFRDVRFDAGGVNVASATSWIMENTWLGSTFYALRADSNITASSLDIPVGRGATFVFAAYNSSDQSKAQADYVLDGVDDQVEINAAIALLPDNGGVSTLPEGGRIFLLEGQYITSAPIVVDKDGVTIEGQGVGAFSSSTEIWLANNSDSNIITVETNAGASQTQGFTLKNLRLEGNKANQASGNGLYANYVAGMVVENVTISYCKEDGLNITAGVGDTSHTINVFHSAFSWNDGNGVQLLRTGAIAFIKSYFENNVLSGMVAGSGGTVYILFGHFESNTDAIDLSISTTVAGSKVIGSTFDKRVVLSYEGSCKLIGNEISVTSGYAISIDGIGTAKDTNHVIMGNTISGQYGIDLSRARNNVIRGNYISTTVAGYAVVEANGADYNTVEGNILDGAADLRYLAGEYTKAFETKADLFMDVLAVSATYVRSNEDLSAGIPITFTIDAQPDVPRTLSGHFDTHAQITAYTIVATGVDAKGSSITETKTEADGWDWETSYAFATITSIIMTARTGTGVGDTMDIGITDVLGLSGRINRTAHVYKIKKNNANATVAGAQVDTTYDTYDMVVIGLGAADDFTIWFRSNLNTVS